MKNITLAGKLTATKQIFFGTGNQIILNKDAFNSLYINIHRDFLSKVFAIKFTNPNMADFTTSKRKLVAGKLNYVLPTQLLNFAGTLTVQLLIFDTMEQETTQNVSNINKQFLLRNGAGTPDATTFGNIIEGFYKSKAGMDIADIDRMLNEISPHPTFNDFPTVGERGTIYLDKTAKVLYFWNTDESEYKPINDISNKVDKIEGKGLSTEDYTTEDKNKLDGIDNNATAYKPLVFDNIAERDAEPVLLHSLVTVLDASDDNEVESGWGFYQNLKNDIYENIVSNATLMLDAIELTKATSVEFAFDEFVAKRYIAEVEEVTYMLTIAFQNVEIESKEYVAGETVLFISDEGEFDSIIDYSEQPEQIELGENTITGITYETIKDFEWLLINKEVVEQS